MANELNYAAIAKAFDQFLVKNNPTYLLLGEDHNGGGMNLDVLKNPQVLAVLQKHGFHDIALEARHEMQDSANSVADGKMTPAQLADAAVKMYRDAGDPLAEDARGSYQDRGALVIDAHKRGFMVHFVDVRDKNVSEYAAETNKADAQISALANMLNNASDKRIGDFEKMGERYPGEDPVSKAAFLHDVRRLQAQMIQESPSMRGLNEHLFNGATAQDDKIANSIRSSADGRKAVVLYGAWHGAGPADLDEKLKSGGAKTARIILAENTDTVITLAQRDDVMKKQKPDAYLNLSSAEMVPGPQAVNYGTLPALTASYSQFNFPTPK